MARNAHIRATHVTAIRDAINEWTGPKLLWEDVCSLAEPILGYRPTRSGLSAHADIQAAYNGVTTTLRTRPAGKAPSPGSLAQASRMLAARDNEIRTLSQQLTDLREKFDRWRYNASLLDVKIDALNKPLPAISRKD